MVEAGVAPSILIIEDDDDIRGFAAKVMEMEGYVVFQAAGGVEGLGLARRDRPSLVLLDLRLPDCDGWSVLSQLREDAGLSRVPVVMFTASAAESQRSQALARGVAGYLVKPLSATSLRDGVRAVLRGAKGH